MLKKIDKETIKNFLVILLGNLFLAIGYVFFSVKVNVVTGGVAGIGIILNELFEIKYSTFVAIGTWALFFVGLIFLGKKFALRTLVSSIAYPLFTVLCELLSNYLDKTFPEIFQINANDTGTLILYAIFSAIFVGYGIGLVFKKGGSTGGLDIPCLMIAKKLKIGVDRVVFIFDACIVIASAFIVGFVPALVGVISAYLCGVMIDRAIISGNESFMIHILSEKHEDINYFINYTMERGTTYVHGEGGYTYQSKKIIEVVIDKREYHTLKEQVHKIDSNAFMIVINARDVFGYGFKDYHKED